MPRTMPCGAHAEQWRTGCRAPFVETLHKAGYCREWKEKFGADAWAKLEKYTGPPDV